MKKNSNPECVMGIHSLWELLKYHPGKISKVLIQKSEELSERKSALIEHLINLAIPFDYAKKETLSSYANSDSHQGFVAFLKKRSYLDLHLFLQRSQKSAFVLAIDNVFDPQNFGALLRSAECFGVNAILWSKNRGVGITPVVTKASSEASELLDLIQVSNLASTLQIMQKKGFSLIAANADPDSTMLSQFIFPPKSVLIMGSEGEGIQPLVRKMCDKSVYIPMYGKISSLNVSQAAAVFLSFWRAQLLNL